MGEGVQAGGFIGVVCGLQSEAAAVRSAYAGDNIRIGVSGANAARAEEIAKAFCGEGACCIISAGVSGGLDPALKPGDLIVADEVVIAEGAKNFKSAPSYADEIFDVLKQEDGGALLGDGQAIERGLVYGSDIIIDSPAHKARLYQQTKACAVDMESHGAARAAISAQIPFLAVRAIADPAQRVLPPAALNAVRADGSTDIWAVLRALVLRPQQLPALSALGVDARIADQRMRAAFIPLLRRLLFRFDLS